MVIGFKTGPKNWEAAKQIVLEDGAQMCEVWFNVNKADEYQEMFTWLTQHGVIIGLHHWGVVDGKFKTNLATQDEHVRQESLLQIKQAIDIGGKIGAVYVNAHPGAQRLETMDFDKEEQMLVADSETPLITSTELLLQGGRELHEYASAQGVLLTIETMLSRENRYYIRREGLYDAGTPSLAVMERLGKQGTYIANDITHSAASIAAQENSREGMWQELFRFTKATAPFTKLIHANTVREPFDGSDSHDGLLPSDFAQGVFPNRDQILELLRLFKNREDVFAVPEPQIETTRENYRELKKIAEEAKVA